MEAFGWINILVLMVYLTLMIGVGLRCAGRQQGTEDYFLAGRRLPWLAVGMSMFASLTSATTYMGVPAFAYQHNIAMLFGVMMSLVAAPILIRWFYPVYRSRGVTTSYEYILQRYGPGARYAVSTLFVLGRLGWLGIAIYAPAKALSVVSGLPLLLAIVTIGLLAVTYTILGGLAAVIWTDVIQFVILVGGALWLSGMLIVQVPGGITEILTVARDNGKFAVWDWTDWSGLTAVSAMIGWFFFFLNDYGTDQVTVQRLLAVRSDRGVVKAVGFNAVNDLFINGLLIFIGLGMAAYFQAFPQRLSGDVETDGILPYFIMHALPPGVSGLMVTAIFAAAMSSVDSGINSLATVVVNDFVRPLWRRPLPSLQEMMLARWITVVLGVFATLTAVYAARIEGIVTMWMKVMGLFSAPVLAIFVLGLFTRRACFVGWLIGALGGMGLTLYLQYACKEQLMEIWYFPISFLVTTVIGYLASLCCVPHGSE